MATPKSNWAFFFTAVRLPVECHMMAVLASRKFFLSVPHSIVPEGITPWTAPRSRQNCSASCVAGAS